MTNTTRLLVTLANALVVASVFPASAQTGVSARIPFEFQVAGETLPRDVYRLSRAADGSHALIVRSERRAVIVLARQGKPYTRAEHPQLVFHRVGKDYFLREVQFPGSSGLDLPETSDEREAKERLASVGPAGVQRVVLALR
jgi:hypothetical protein